MLLGEAIAARHSVRKFLKEPISDEDIAYIIDNARLAPSWRNGQCWRFVVVRDPGKLKTLAQAVGQVNGWIDQVPALAVATADPGRSGGMNGIEYFIADVAMALQNAMLAATDIGLGMCFLANFDEVKVKHILSIPDNIRVVALSPIGRPEEGGGLKDKALKALFTRNRGRKLSLDQVLAMEVW